MYERILNFIKYNNAFTIIFVIVFFSFGITFAASPAVRESVYSSSETIVSVDNGAIVSADLNNFNFNLRISSITEDDKNYYAGYSYQTLVIEDSVWQSKEIEKTLTVNKEALNGKDLGLYVAKELGDNINSELSYLKRVQKLEKDKGESQKVVTVEYSGLIGKLLDPKEMVIEGYNPVIPESVPEIPATVESNPEEVIVSTPYTVPQENPVSPIDTPVSATPELTPPQTVSEVEQELTSTSTATSTLPQTEIVQESTPLPAPEEMVDEELIQEVVEVLLQNEASSTSSSVSEPASSSVPEITPEPTVEIESTSTSEVV